MNAGLLHALDRVVPVISIVLIMIGGLGIITYAVLRLLGLRWLLKRGMVFLEITPPAFTDRHHQATGELFSVLHGLGSLRSLQDRLLHRKMVFALEMVSTKDGGIRYIIQVDRREAASFCQTLAAYLPETKITEVKDYLPADLSKARPISFKQSGHFAFPLAALRELDTHDPIAYLTGAMTKLEHRELMAFQLVLEPTQVPKAAELDYKLLGNEDMLRELRGRQKALLAFVFRLANHTLSAVTELIGEFISGSSHYGSTTAARERHDQVQIAKRAKPARQLSAFEQELAASIHDKVRQPLYKVRIRALAAASSQVATKQRLKAVRASLAPLTVPKYQSLKSQRQWFGRYSNSYRRSAFRQRLPALLTKDTCILAVSEVADLYHFPHSRSAKTENVVKSLSKTLPAPVSLKSGTPLDIVLGENRYHGSVTPIGLTAAERERHVYIIGGTGNGKTTMLLYGIVQDIQNGKGLAVIDPHGDLAEGVLRHIPEKRIKDVIYLNPDDLEHPIGINLLELRPGLSELDLLREKDLITESTISVLRKIFSDDDSGGHRIEYIVRNTVQTALTLENPTLFTIFKLLTDAKYRRSAIKDLKDEDLKNFWANELGKAGEFQRVKMSAGITAKIGRFLFSASAKRILEQEKSTIDFDDIIDSGKILVCNFSKGLIGEDTSTLFGTTVLAKLQMAALRRARQKQTERRPFYLYVDEFQNFATTAFVQMLSEARKYRLFLTMAEQSTSQQDQQRLVDIILANVGTVVCFRSGSPVDERLMLPLFMPYVEQGEVANLPAYNFYARIAAVNSQEPMSGNTLLVEGRGSEETAQAAVMHSRKHYGRMRSDKRPKSRKSTTEKTEARQRQPTAESPQKPGSLQSDVPTS